MATGRRVKLLPHHPIQPGEKVQFRFEGRSVDGFDHEPLAAALLAAGVRTFGRSIKYHRPRGPFCLHRHCSSCLMRVDGFPNVRTCESLCRSGMVVERQGGWPGPKWDVFRMVDWLAPDTLDHHGMFTASTTLNRVASRFVRKLSGLGDPPSADPPRPVKFERFDAPVVVVGAGAAGLVAAETLAGCGHKVVLLETDAHRGGRLLDGACRLPGPDGAPCSGWDSLDERRARLEQTEGIETHVKTPALAIYPADHRFQVLAANQGECIQIDASRLVMCTGAYENAALFANNDLPGVFGLRALDRLVFTYGVSPGEPVVLAGDCEDTLVVGNLLAEVGIALAGVVTGLREGQALEQLKSRNVPVFHDRRVIRAHGSRELDRVELAPAHSDDPDLVLDCKVLAVAGPQAPAYELAHHVGCRVFFDSRAGYVVKTGPDGRTSNSQVFAAGHCAGATSIEEAIRQGERAGLACALSLNPDPEVGKRLEACLPPQPEGSHG